MASKAVTLELPPIKIETHSIFIIGTTPLICHAFPEKARKMMLAKQMKEAKGGRDARDPYEEVEAARYALGGGIDGIPAVAFKDTAVTACTSLADITKIAARQAFQVRGIPMNKPGCIEGSFQRTALIPLVSGDPVIREDVARLSGIGRTPEMRYRPEYSPWGVRLLVNLNSQVISISQLITMYQAAGHGVGVGDYRAERDGNSGGFEPVDEKVFLRWCGKHGLLDRYQEIVTGVYAESIDRHENGEA